MVQTGYERMRLDVAKEEADRLQRDLELLTTRGSDGTHLYQELTVLLNAIVNGGFCDEEAYLGIAERIVAFLAPDAPTSQVGNALLSLTRLHYAVGEIIGRHRLTQDVGRVVSESPDDFTAANRTLVADLLFNYHLWESHRRRREGGVAGFRKVP